jgi:hypothetical protein
MDAPNVLWFAGAYAAAIASYGLLSTLPTSHRSLWILLLALVFLASYAVAAGVLLTREWWIPGGLVAAGGRDDACRRRLLPAVDREALNENRWPFALALVWLAVSILAMGML